MNLAASVLSAFASLASATAPGPQPFDYKGAFAKSFPAVGEEHRIVDWSLYVALVTGDVVTYARRIDPAIGAEMDRVKGKAYQSEQLEERIKGDSRLVAAFGGQSRRIKVMTLFVESRGGDLNGCEHPLVYTANEFRIVLGQSTEGGDPQSHAAIAPGCPQVLETRFQITAGHSPRFKCWSSTYLTTCGWRLPDMPVDLKQVIENIYPGSVTLRWRWRGLAGVTRTRYVDANSNRVAQGNSIALTIPHDLGLEFIDQGGNILWTAASALPSPQIALRAASKLR